MNLNSAGTVWAPIISALFAGVSAIMAWYAIARPQKQATSKAIMDQAILSLERAYDVLTEGGKHVGLPPANRLNWLTAARHIVTYKNLRAKITDEAHGLIADDHAEWWRNKFYVALKMHQIHDAGYYKNDAAGKGNELAPDSLVVVYDFASWPDGHEDPLTDEAVESALTRGSLFTGNLGLETYIKSFPGYRRHSPTK